MQLPCPRRPEALARVVQVPDVEVAHLGAFGRGDADDVAGGDGPGAAGADGEGEGLGWVAWRRGDGVVEGFVDV